MKSLASCLSRGLLADLPHTPSRRLAVAVARRCLHSSTPTANAGDDLTRAQRIRKRIWGDPGPADPYRELTPEEREQREIQLLEAEEAEKSKTATEKHKAAKAQDSLERSANYVPDTDARAMLIVGTRGAFMRRKWDPQHRFIKFLGKRVTDSAEITAAVRRAVIETYTQTITRSGPTAACVTYRGPEYLTDRVIVTRANGEGNTFNFDFRSPYIMHRINQYASDWQPIPSDREIVKDITKPKFDDWKNLTLVDDALKFAVVKRSMQLTGIRLIDPLINEATTANQLLKQFLKVAAQSQTTRLAPALADSPTLQELPNVTVHQYQVKFTDRERAIGRLETIPIMMAGRVRREGEVIGRPGSARGGRRAVSRSMLRLRARKIKGVGVTGIESFRYQRQQRRAAEQAALTVVEEQAEAPREMQ